MSVKYLDQKVHLRHWLGVVGSIPGLEPWRVLTSYPRVRLNGRKLWQVHGCTEPLESPALSIVFSHSVQPSSRFWLEILRWKPSVRETRSAKDPPCSSLQATQYPIQICETHLLTMTVINYKKISTVSLHETDKFIKVQTIRADNGADHKKENTMNPEILPNLHEQFLSLQHTLKNGKGNFLRSLSIHFRIQPLTWSRIQGTTCSSVWRKLQRQRRLLSCW